MFVHVKDAKYLHDYVIWLRFSDGAEGEIDLAANSTERSLVRCAIRRHFAVSAWTRSWRPSSGKTARTWRRSSSTRT